jgi:hypothetical protein
MTCPHVFEPDDEYDQTCASDGLSRYGVYLTHHANWFADDEEPTADPGRFAAAAWLVALPPTMSPGYVRAHGRVQDVYVRWDEEQSEAAGLTYPWRRWTCDEHGRWREPDEYARPNVLSVLRIAVPLAGIPLPDPRYQHGLADTRTAKQAVRAICATINAALRSVVAFDPLARSPQ